MDTGDIELHAEELRILNTCEGPLPFQIREFFEVITLSSTVV